MSDEHWINEPSHWRQDGGTLDVRTGKDTDFWNNTFYRFRHGNGHFLARPIAADLSLQLTFSSAYSRLYDQPGARLRVDDDNWLKTATEFTDGALQFSVVVTRDDQSDWSVMELGGDPAAPITLRLTRHAEALRVQL